ncbi:hypothetical protein ACET3Z_031682 [Daucus carota]
MIVRPSMTIRPADATDYPPYVTEWPTWPRVEKVDGFCSEVITSTSGGKPQCKGGKGKGKKSAMPPPLYSGPNVYGLSKEAPIKQYTTAVGGVTIESPKFVKNGQLVLTSGALHKAMGDARMKLCEQQSKVCEQQSKVKQVSNPKDNANAAEQPQKSG